MKTEEDSSDEEESPAQKKGLSNNQAHDSSQMILISLFNAIPRKQSLAPSNTSESSMPTLMPEAHKMDELVSAAIELGDPCPLSEDESEDSAPSLDDRPTESNKKHKPHR